MKQLTLGMTTEEDPQGGVIRICAVAKTRGSEYVAVDSISNITSSQLATSEMLKSAKRMALDKLMAHLVEEGKL